MSDSALGSPEGDQDEAEALTLEEVRVAIEHLGPADMLRLAKAAAHFEYRNGRLARDLRQEAFVRVLDGRRKCPRNVNLALSLSNVMRSIASERDREAEHADIDEMIAADSLEAGSMSGIGPDLLEQVRGKLDGEQLLSEALRLFEDNERAKTMFEGIIEDMEGQELRELLGVSQVEFDTLRRLVRRRLDKHFRDRKS
ncbi:hypothetical protein [Lichenifustis flavocetrariae]|uniref:Uncharacterized protein n=1 Tax=Lichenifustis flavocetrariae TaxID=2949735 RepID=A0AA42CJS9_9HYPH|nr:hypothetical protein [Lichenifustis flavocetrariae]MCW6509873.1 hypothetical protein [Lichenifustis flavocetrariae]